MNYTEYVNMGEEALKALMTLPVGILKSQDDHDEICGMCGENVNDPHLPTCTACTAEGKTCEGGIGKWDGLD